MDFEIFCEVEPATQPDLSHVRDQIQVMGDLATGFLIPDNHIGRATVSSIAVAHEVAEIGGRAIACLNAKLQPARVPERPADGRCLRGRRVPVRVRRPARVGEEINDLTVRTMIDEARRFDPPPSGQPSKPRLIDPGPFVIQALQTVLSDPTAFAEIVYYEAMRDDALLRDFATDRLYELYSSGRSHVTVEDTLAWFATLKEPRVRAWSETVRVKVGRGLLAALRDFGVLEGAAKKRFRAPRMSTRGFAYAAWRITREAGADRAVFTTDIWRAWLLDARRVEGLALELDRHGVWRYAAAGSSARIDWASRDVCEVLDAAA